MNPRARWFLALVLVQAAHSIEECWFRLYDVLLPARLVASLFSRNLGVGFAIGNALIVLFGLVCYVAVIRRDRPMAPTIARGWLLVEAVNGTGHLLFAAMAGGYFPGAATAPGLLICAIGLARSMRSSRV